MEKENIWQQVQKQLDQLDTSNSSARHAFFLELNPELFTDNEFILSTNSSVIYDFVSRNYIDRISDSLSSLTGREYKVELHLKDGGQPSQAPTGVISTPQTQSSISQVETRDTFSTPGNSYQEQHTQHTPERQDYRYGQRVVETSSFTTKGNKTFENFVVDETNNFAYSLARGVAEDPGNLYNPLFIYGTSGLGKTHLLLAIDNFIEFHIPNLRITYAPTSEFVNDFTNGISQQQMDRFSDKYKNCDVLLLDDIQVLEGKVGCTEEVFNIFNSMITRGKQIIMCADRPPKTLNIDERYSSRFSSGIIAKIEPPTFETKMAILKNCITSKFKAAGIEDYIISEDIYTRIVEKSNSNIRNLEGVATTLVAWMSGVRNTSTPLTIDEVENIIDNVFLPASRKKITIPMIQREVENYYHISHQDMIGSKRSHNISQPRQIAMWLARTLTDDLSYPEIGRSFGGKNHTTVMYSVNIIEKKRLEDPQVKADIEHLIGILEE